MVRNQKGDQSAHFFWLAQALARHVLGYFSLERIERVLYPLFAADFVPGFALTPVVSLLLAVA